MRDRYSAGHHEGIEVLFVLKSALQRRDGVLRTSYRSRIECRWFDGLFRREGPIQKVRLFKFGRFRAIAIRSM